ncbi:Mrp/NBP35 family ATP-binding protein [uncultured Alistipes sp.]|jgi:ATP-binding protein involved in chromosome partitioning|uniref:Mrp/NBP35 family ATP-binding protein n=1 Tax=uncultured Alistipes sp. TaxID=538949 RepID=UPI0025F70484|nr:Mrp/NBP35 family ATP-binding protein [uncultured Alistipes sp.]
METQIKQLLGTVVHPETGTDIVTSGMIEHLAATNEKKTVVLRFAKARDPFAVKIKNQVEALLKEHFPQSEILVVVKEGGQAPRPEPKEKTTTGSIAHIVAIASGKGGVGKSTVTANLAIALRNMGFRVGILDADIYGPSQPKMFGVEGYVPDAVQEDGTDLIVPAESMDIRLMSIGFFIKPTDALLWRGAMAVNALKQMIHQTKWGPLDFLLLDLPPGTGDIHLSIIGELKIDSAAIVSTPQQVAVADVVRGAEMFRNPNVNIPIAGIIENMAWFTPEELPENRYYLFGKGGARRFAEENGIGLLGEIPIVQSIMEGAEEGRPATAIDPRVEQHYREIAERIVENVMKKR